MDRLDELFRLQAAFDEEVARRRNLSFDPATWVQKEVLAMVSELAEILDEVSFKWWKDPRPLDHGRLTEEMVDLLHFFLSTCLKLGITPDELFEAYRAKNEENFRRQRGESDRPGYHAPAR
ncbi:dUTPase [Limnochorda pilosa]|uniref:dUTPase n=1 Tax=Limnochorda pilosa TaxID=1555112 RepID=A0A0K2SMP7_LIMPI|nr:dUTPase [Limnochorda pilosa]BAS28403.1 dUTPase [Limnochorda pilosa]